MITEAEWEYAAHGGNKSQGYKYSGSNNLNDVAWYSENSGGNTHPVGTKRPNELGIYDMSGNIQEMCYDFLFTYPSSEQSDPMGPSSGNYRVHRGGFYNQHHGNCRVSNRRDYNPDNRYNSLGFRIALYQ